MLEVDSPKWENTKIKWAKDTVRLLSLYALFYPFLGSPILRFPVSMGEGEILLCPGWRALRSPAQEAHKWIAASLDTSRHELCSLEEEESGIYWAHTFSIPGTGSGLSWTRFMQSPFWEHRCITMQRSTGRVGVEGDVRRAGNVLWVRYFHSTFYGEEMEFLRASVAWLRGWN